MDYPPNAGRPLPGYEDFAKAMSKASYHNACDNNSEMHLAHEAEVRAAEIAIENDWAYWQIVQAHAACKPLVAFDSLMHKIMTKLKAGT